MTDQLYPHQDDGASRIVRGLPTYLAFDMGIGKSRTFIEAALKAGAKRVLILCPASAVLVWKRELGLWAPGETFTVVRRAKDFDAEVRFFIVSHGLLSQRDGDVAGALPKIPAFAMTAIDEAHAFNSADSLRVKALRAAAKNLGHIVPLSGTPMRNHAGDLYTLTSICAPEVLRTPFGSPINRTDFENLFCRVSSRNFNGRIVRVIEGSKNLDTLKQMLKPFVLRVRKEDVLKDLPPIQWDRVPIPLDHALMAPGDAKHFDNIVEGLIGKVTDKSSADLTAMAETLTAAADSPHLMTLRRLLGNAKLRGACDYLVDMLDNLPADRKVLVFAVHREVARALHNHLGEYDPAVITGETSSADRETAVSKFLTKPQCRVFIGNIQAAGTALTLVGPTCKCSDVVFVESSWTPSDNAQAACRVHRIGQRDGVNARMLCADGTIDDVIASILIRKAREFSQLFDDAVTNPGDSHK